MLKVSLDQIIPITQARSRLSELVEKTENKHFWILTKGGKPRAALVDVDYLDQLVRQAEFNDLARRLAPNLPEV
jgi:prevent-host-death family protein